jgi:hypothetical protein
MALQNAQSIGFFRSLLKVATDTERTEIMQGVNPTLYSAWTQVCRDSKNIKKLNVESAEELVGYVSDAEKLYSIKAIDKRVMVGLAVDYRLRDIGAVAVETSCRTWTPYNSVVVTAKTKKVLQGSSEEIVLLNLSRMPQRDDKLVAAWVENISDGGIVSLLNLMQTSNRMLSSEAEHVIGKRLMNLELSLFDQIGPKAHVGNDALEAALQGWDYVVCERLAHVLSMVPGFVVARAFLGAQASTEMRNATVSLEALAVWRKRHDYGMLLFAGALSESEILAHMGTLESTASYSRMETLRFARRATDIHLIVEECYRRGWWNDARAQEKFRWSSNTEASTWLAAAGLNENTARSIINQGSNECVVLYLLGHWGAPSSEMVSYGGSLLCLDDLDIRSSSNGLISSWSNSDGYIALVRAICVNSPSAATRVVSSHYTWSPELARATLSVLCETLETNPDKWAVFASLLTNSEEQHLQALADAADALA